MALLPVCGVQQVVGSCYSKAARHVCLGMPYVVKMVLEDKVGTGHTFQVLYTSKLNVFVLCTTCGRWSGKTIRAGGLGSLPLPSGQGS